jgi:hypothetical protein
MKRLTLSAFLAGLMPGLAQAAPQHFSTLADCSSENAGTVATIDDGPRNPTWNSTISAGGGTGVIGVHCDGNSWKAYAGGALATKPATVASDPDLMAGNATSLTWSLGGGQTANVNSKTTPNPQLWILHADPWGINTGSGKIKWSYSGTGTATATVAMTGINTDKVVSAYPFIGFGRDTWGYTNGTQGLTIPTQLSAISSLILDFKYSITGGSGNSDVLFDFGIMPTDTFSGGLPGAVEIEVLPYFNFTVDGRCCTYMKTIQTSAIMNGVQTTLSWDMHRNGTGVGSDVLFYPSGSNNIGYASADMRFDVLPLLLEAAGPSGANVGTSWYFGQVPFGIEFGKSASQNITFIVNKLRVEQTMK